MDWKSLREKVRRRVGPIAARWQKADCVTQAAAISYFSALSLFPFLVVLITGVGIFFDTFEQGKSAEAEVMGLLSEVFSPDLAKAVGGVFDSFRSQASIGGPLAMLALLYLSSRVFYQMDRAFLRIWRKDNPRRHGFRRSATYVLGRRLRSIAIVLGFFVIVLLVFYGGTVLYTLESALDTWLPEANPIWSVRSSLVSLAVTTIVFGSIYRILSRGPVTWKLCFSVGLLIAFLWDLGRGALTLLVIGERYTALGVIGSFLAILVWIYYSSLALLFGGVLVRDLGLRRTGREAEDEAESPSAERPDPSSSEGQS